MGLRTLPRTAVGVGVGASRGEVLTLADQQRLKRYQGYQDWYDGKHWSKERAGRANLVANYARAMVDKGVSYLLGRGVNFTVVEGGRAGGAGSQESSRAEVAEEFLYEVYEENDLAAVDSQAATNGAVLGDTVFKVLWDPELGRVRVANQDPCRFFAKWREDDLAVLTRAHSVYWLAVEDAERRFGGEFAGAAGPSLVGGGPTQTDERRQWVPVVESWGERRLEIWAGDRKVVDAANPYGFIPFVHIPNARPANQFWGVSDLRDLIPLNRELNERMSDVADVIRFHADPPVVFKGISEHTDMVVGPGTVWDVPEGSDVSLLEWKGSQPAVFEHFDRVMRALHDVAETPKTAFGETGRVQSGVALEVEMMSLVQKTLRKRAWWTAGLRRRALMVLRIGELMGAVRLSGGGGGAGSAMEGLRVKVVWPQLLPSDQEADVRNNVALVAAGLRSRRTAMDRLGEESPEEEMARIEGEKGEGVGERGVRGGGWDVVSEGAVGGSGGVADGGGHLGVPGGPGGG